MQTEDKEKIKARVRDTYGRIARSGAENSTAASSAGCCGPAQTSGPQTAAACGPCCGPSVSLESYAELLGYSGADSDLSPPGANLGLGCGNPLALAALKPGETVLDLGCGAGFDCFLAAEKVGPAGKVIGVDMTPEMFAKARRNAATIAAANVEFRLGEIEHLPAADNSVDVIISNCVINLAPDKQQVFEDACRVLKPGGRLMIADIVATAELPDEIRQDMALVAACVGGAATIAKTRSMLAAAGFSRIKITPKENSRQLIASWLPETLKSAADWVVAAYIEALKPA